VCFVSVILSDKKTKFKKLHVRLFISSVIDVLYSQFIQRVASSFVIIHIYIIHIHILYPIIYCPFYVHVNWLVLRMACVVLYSRSAILLTVSSV
jgi:hypothetical protein